jgi:putative peptidoglycan lipid II flippase
LFFTIGFYGLALATSVAAWVNVICLAAVLLRNENFAPDMRLLSRLPRIVLASAAMSVALVGLIPVFEPHLTGQFLRDFLALGMGCAIGGVIYAAAAVLLRAFNMSDIRDAVKRR